MKWLAKNLAYINKTVVEMQSSKARIDSGVRGMSHLNNSAHNMRYTGAWLAVEIGGEASFWSMLEKCPDHG